MKIEGRGWEQARRSGGRIGNDWNSGIAVKPPDKIGLYLAPVDRPRAAFITRRVAVEGKAKPDGAKAMNCTSRSPERTPGAEFGPYSVPPALSGSSRGSIREVCKRFSKGNRGDGGSTRGASSADPFDTNSLISENTLPLA